MSRRHIMVPRDREPVVPNDEAVSGYAVFVTDDGRVNQVRVEPASPGWEQLRTRDFGVVIPRSNVFAVFNTEAEAAMGFKEAAAAIDKDSDERMMQHPAPEFGKYGRHIKFDLEFTGLMGGTVTLYPVDEITQRFMAKRPVLMRHIADRVLANFIGIRVGDARDMRAMAAAICQYLTTFFTEIGVKVTVDVPAIDKSRSPAQMAGTTFELGASIEMTDQVAGLEELIEYAVLPYVNAGDHLGVLADALLERGIIKVTDQKPLPLVVAQEWLDRRRKPDYPPLVEMTDHWERQEWFIPEVMGHIFDGKKVHILTPNRSTSEYVQERMVGEIDRRWNSPADFGVVNAMRRDNSQYIVRSRLWVTSRDQPRPVITPLQARYSIPGTAMDDMLELGPFQRRPQPPVVRSPYADPVRQVQPAWRQRR